VGEAQSFCRLDDRDHGRAVVAESGDRLGRRLRQDDRLQRELTGCGEVVPEPLRVGAIDADDGRAEPDDEFARLALAVGRDRVLEVGDDRVGLGGERLRQLRLVGAGGEEQRAETVERSRVSFMSDIRTGRKSGSAAAP
jgi:hypothetical protein